MNGDFLSNMFSPHFIAFEVKNKKGLLPTHNGNWLATVPANFISPCGCWRLSGKIICGTSFGHLLALWVPPQAIGPPALCWPICPPPP